MTNEELFNKLYKIKDDLTTWEKDFIDSISKYDKRKLSGKQIVVLWDMCLKYNIKNS